jgi:hypothetical protein
MKILILLILVFSFGCATVDNKYISKEEFEKHRTEMEKFRDVSLAIDMEIIRGFKDLVEVYNNHIRNLHSLRQKQQINTME